MSDSDEDTGLLPPPGVSVSVFVHIHTYRTLTGQAHWQSCHISTFLSYFREPEAVSRLGGPRLCVPSYLATILSSVALKPENHPNRYVCQCSGATPPIPIYIHDRSSSSYSLHYNPYCTPFRSTITNLPRIRNWKIVYRSFLCRITSSTSSCRISPNRHTPLNGMHIFGMLRKEGAWVISYLELLRL
jgi:hypothetical protein